MEKEEKQEKFIKEAVEWQEWRDKCDWAYTWFCDDNEEFNEYARKSLRWGENSNQ